MSVWVAMLLGLLQGAAVFLPISSVGHLSVLQNFLKLDIPTAGPFSFLMSLSTLISILLVYRKDIGPMLREGYDFLRGREADNPMSEGRMAPSIRMLYFIIVGTLPLLITVPINNNLGILLKNSTFIGFAMIAMGALLFAADRFIKAGKKTERTMSAKDALIVGIGQALAVIPGLSRTGTTVTLSLLRGLKKDFSVRYSIYLSLPTVVIAILSSFFTLFKSSSEWASLFVYLIAFVISVITGYFSIQILRLAVRRKKIRNFSYYLWAAGVIIITLSFIL